MKFLIQFFEPEAEFALRTANTEASAAYWGAWTLFGEQVKASGAFVQGNALVCPKEARTVVVRDGKRMVHDGPFAETREMLGGFFILESPDIDTAIELASKSPAARYGSVEVRQLMPDCEG